MKHIITVVLLLGGLATFAQNRGDLISFEENFDYSISEARDKVNELVPLDLAEFLVNILVYVKHPLKGYKVVYHTIDFDGNPAQASGLLVIPQGLRCEAPLATYCHGTIFDKQAVPSNFMGEAGGAEDVVSLAFGGAGYVIALPDYLGMGDSPGFHPFVNAKTEATATIDMLRAARQLCAQVGVGLSGQVFVTGYSQGGHSAMATIKEIAERHANEFHVEFAGLGSGPYDLSGIQYEYIFDDPSYPSPQFVPYVIGSCEETRGDLYDDPGDIFVPPYDELYVSEILGQTGNTDWVPTPWTDLFQEGYLEAVANDPNHPLRACLRANNVYDWRNETATTMYFCPPDEQIDPENAKFTKRIQRAYFPWYKFWQRKRIKTLNSGNSDHPNCAIPALLFARAGFNLRKKICLFSTQSTTPALASTSGNSWASEAGIMLPEMSYYGFALDASQYSGQLIEVEVLDMEGESVFQRKNLSGDTWNLPTQGLEDGFYAIRVKDENGQEHWSLTLLQKPELVEFDDYDPVFPNPLAIQSDLDLSLLDEQVSAVNIRSESGEIVRQLSIDNQVHVKLQRGRLPNAGHIVEVVTEKESYFLPLHTTNTLDIEELRLSPNPLRDRSTLDISIFEGSIRHIRLLDIQGRQVWSMVPDAYQPRIVLNRRDWASGVYFLKLETAHQTYQSKLVVE
ncbi:MAG: T9SS type A sorting domain-containing protein [Bacteroidota bacterium]